MRKYAIVTAAVAVLLAGFDAKAEEGMWTFNNFPFDSIEKSYGFRPSGAWLDHLRLSSVRLADGCSAAFVSPHGLVQTNHHCVRGCIQDLSTASQDYDANGFNAKNEKDELQWSMSERCAWRWTRSITQSASSGNWPSSKLTE